MKNKIFFLLLSSFVAGFLIYPLTFLLSDLFPGPNGGLDSLGDAVFQIYLILLTTYILQSIFMFIVLYYFKINYKILLIFLATITLFPFYRLLLEVQYIVNANFLLNDSQTSIIFYVISGIIFSIVYLIYYIVISVQKINITKISILILIILGFMLYITRLGSEIHSKQTAKEEQKKFKELRYNIFLPTYLPSNYHFDGYDQAVPDLFLTVTYLKYDEDSSEIYINNFKANNNFNPPLNCGEEHPSETEQIIPCQEVGTTFDGNKVYNTNIPYGESEKYIAYIKKGSTVITIMSYNKLSVEEMLKIFNSLDNKSYENLLKEGILYKH